MKYILTILFVLVASSVVLSDSVTLDGQSNVDDAYGDANYPDVSRATETWIYVKCGFSACTFQAYLRFNLSGISCTVDSICLYMRRHTPDYAFQVYFYRLTQDWTEETDLNPEVTWNDASSGTGWTTPGGTFNSTIIDSLTDKGGTSYNEDVYCQRGCGAGLAQLVQEWVDGTYNNYGLLLKSALMNVEDTLYFWSSENFNESSYPRPKLYIEYTPDGSAGLSTRRRKVLLGGF